MVPQSCISTYKRAVSLCAPDNCAKLVSISTLGSLSRSESIDLRVIWMSHNSEDIFCRTFAKSVDSVDWLGINVPLVSVKFTYVSISTRNPACVCNNKAICGEKEFA